MIILLVLFDRYAPAAHKKYPHVGYTTQRKSSRASQSWNISDFCKKNRHFEGQNEENHDLEISNIGYKTNTFGFSFKHIYAFVLEKFAVKKFPFKIFLPPY